jgi:hypothetical protein
MQAVEQTTQLNNPSSGLEHYIQRKSRDATMITNSDAPGTAASSGSGV